MKVLSKSVEETQIVAKNFIDKISMGVYDKALVVGLYGDLGSGKTTFTQSVAKIFGIEEDITSPTFVIEKIYDIKHAKFTNLVHIDAYRLESAKELAVLDWERTVGDPKNIIFIEWPEKVLKILPENHAKIYFKFITDSEREIEF
jgi:tRNA threonylcarbamoyladenosine biosynthesis protein TsaE